MNLRYLLISILWALGACILYFVHVWSIKDQDMNDEFTKFKITYGSIKNWVLIILLCILSIAYFFKAL